MNTGSEDLYLVMVTVGAIFAFLLVIVLAVYGYFKIKSRLEDSCVPCEAYSLSWLPGRIQLVRRETLSAAKQDRVDRRKAGFREQGFEEEAIFETAGDLGLCLHVLRHPVSGLIGVVYYLDDFGTWSDVFFQDAVTDEVLMASNVRKRLYFDHLPGDRKFHLPAGSEADLAQTVSKERQLASARVVGADRFAAFYERAFARAADTRLLEGWEDYEIRRLLCEAQDPDDKDQKELDDKQLAAVKHYLRTTAAQELRKACVHEFALSGQIAASEWQQCRRRLLVIHDRTPLPELAGTSDEAHVTRELKKVLRKHKADPGPPREMFARINAGLAPAQRYQRIGAVTKPVPADIYRGPLGGLST